MAKFNLLFTVEILIIIIVAYGAVTAWDEAIDRIFFRAFHLEEDTIRSWLFVAVILTFVLVLILILTGIEVHDIFGFAEDAVNELLDMTTPASIKESIT